MRAQSICLFRLLRPRRPSRPAASVLSKRIEKQLGLKLELRKRQEKVLVLDHIERTPIEN